MKANDIKAELVRSGIKIIDIARSLGISGSAVSQVISGNRNTRRIRIAIASAINMKPGDIWSEES